MSDRKNWHEYFIDIAHQVATRSTCDRKHVGCVLVLDKRMISTGYNGSIPGADHCDVVGHDLVESVGKDGKLAPNCVRTVHAEVNAIAQAARAGIPTRGSVAYTNTFPCWPCFKVLASAGIAVVVYDDTYRPDERVLEASRKAGIALMGPDQWKRSSDESAGE